MPLTDRSVVWYAPQPSCSIMNAYGFYTRALSQGLFFEVGVGGDACEEIL